jgi:hypothetical protein
VRFSAFAGDAKTAGLLVLALLFVPASCRRFFRLQ